MRSDGNGPAPVADLQWLGWGLVVGKFYSRGAKGKLRGAEGEW
jgi:hypothetical protein